MPATRRSASRIRNSIARSVGFTLVELLVVIGIIVVLIGILLPVVSHVRSAAQTAASRNFVNELTGAIERYNSDFRAYPGPLSNDEIRLAGSTRTFPSAPFTAYKVVPSGTGSFDTNADGTRFTMSENLVLGLLGGLHVDPSTTTQLDFDPASVGTGPVSLNTAGNAIPKKYNAYLDTKGLSWQDGPNGRTGHYFDASGAANDSIIPEFVDQYPDPMPVIYLRAKVGAGATINPPFRAAYNPIISDDPTFQYGRPGQYDLSQIIGYSGCYTGTWPSQTLVAAPGGSSIGVGKSVAASAYIDASTGSAVFGSGVQANLYHGIRSVLTTSTLGKPGATGVVGAPYPYDAFPYFQGSSGGARQKDSYILISAGPDRVYGTKDDICSFGNVGD